jgi:hypothetical protein
LAIDTILFHCVFVNPCTRLSVHLAIESLMANYCMRWTEYLSLKGSHRIEDEWIFLKNLRATFYNKEQSNEPIFGLIYLAGQFKYEITEFFVFFLLSSSADPLIPLCQWDRTQDCSNFALAVIAITIIHS